MTLRVVVLTMEEPFYLPLAIESLLRRRGSEITLIGAADAPGGRTATLREARRQLLALGPLLFLRKAVQYVGRRLHDRVLGRTSLRRDYSVRAVAERHRIPYESVGDVNAAAFLDRLRAAAPDVVVSVSCPRIFRKELLGIPRLGCINVHNALLPQYRGVLPSFWVLFHGDRETGVTVHGMDERIDTGPILVQRRVAVEPRETQHSLLLKTKALCGEVVDEALNMLERGTPFVDPAGVGKGTYFSFPTRAQARAFRRRGGRWE